MGISSSYIDWVEWFKALMEDPEQELGDDELRERLNSTYAQTRPVYIQSVSPAFINAYSKGQVESGFGMDKEAVETLALNYAAQAVDYTSGMTSEAAVEAYRGILNRGKPHREAWGFMKRVFGVDRRAVRSLLTMFDQPNQKNITLKEGSNTKKQMMDRYVIAAIASRAKMIEAEETFSAKETAKALAWNYAKHEGKLPQSVTKRWVTAQDELVCKVCGPMSNVDVQPNERFTLPNGEKTWAPQVHPNCRCIVKLVIKIVMDRSDIQPSWSAFERVEKSVATAPHTQTLDYNPYRKADGTFATRQENTWQRGMYSQGAYNPVQRVKPVKTIQRAVTPEERKAFIARTDKIFADLKADLNAMQLNDMKHIERRMAELPQLKTKVAPRDPDVKRVVEARRTGVYTAPQQATQTQTKAKPVMVLDKPKEKSWVDDVISEASVDLKDIKVSDPLAMNPAMKMNPDMKAHKRIAYNRSRVQRVEYIGAVTKPITYNTTNIATQAIKFNHVDQAVNVLINLPKVEETTKVDIAATVKAQTGEDLKKNALVNLKDDEDVYAVIQPSSSDIKDQRLITEIAPGTVFTSDLLSTLGRLRDVYENDADALVERHAYDSFKVQGHDGKTYTVEGELLESIIRNMLDWEYQNKAYAIANLNPKFRGQDRYGNDKLHNASHMPIVFDDTRASDDLKVVSEANALFNVKQFVTKNGIGEYERKHQPEIVAIRGYFDPHSATVTYDESGVHDNYEVTNNLIFTKGAKVYDEMKDEAGDGIPVLDLGWDIGDAQEAYDYMEYHGQEEKFGSKPFKTSWTGQDFSDDLDEGEVNMDLDAWE